ncbi:MAG TPA: hypothetical protein PLL71_11825 [Agriterribacter sp.]|nr:hypothetical protein [Agriterribacter sp.]
MSYLFCCPANNSSALLHAGGEDAPQRQFGMHPESGIKRIFIKKQYYVIAESTKQQGQEKRK